MTTSTHTYAAVLVGSPDVELSVRGGSISLDSGRAPHVRGTLQVAVPDESVLVALDPRLNQRIRVVAEAVFPTFSQSRTFDLGLRRRRMNHRDAVVELDLASDEALAEDYAPLADDTTPRTLESSLRGIVDYVLGIVTGGALQPGPDADMTALWPVTNLVPNPSGETTVNGWTASTGASALAVSGAVGGVLGANSVRWTAAAGTSTVIVAGWNGVTTARDLRVEAGKTYTASMYLRSSVARSATFRLAFRDENGVGLSVSADTTAGTSAAGWTRYVVTATAPITAAFAYLVVITAANTAGQFHYGDAIMLHEGAEAVPPFDGASAAAGGYAYGWAGPAHASQSTRTVTADAPAPESLVWRAGQSALDFLHPLVQAAGYRLVCDEQRAWTLRGSGYVAAGGLTIVHGLDMTSATDTLSRDSDGWRDGQVTRYVWPDAAGVTRERFDAFALSGSPSRVVLVEVRAPYPGAGRSEYAVRRAQGRGREVSASKVSDWAACAEQPVSVLLEGAPTQTGLTERIEFDLSTDEITVFTRTTDTGLGSIDLLAGSINGLAGSINGL